MFLRVLLITFFHVKFKHVVLNFIPVDFSCDGRSNSIIYAHGYGSTFMLIVTDKTYFDKISVDLLRVRYVSVVTNTSSSKCLGLLCFSLVRLYMASFMLIKAVAPILRQTDGSNVIGGFSCGADSLPNCGVYDTPKAARLWQCLCA